MSTIALNGQKTNTVGMLPSRGARIPSFMLTKMDLSNVGNNDFSGKRLVFNIFPSIDTPVCAASVRRFNEAASSLENTLVLCVSRDLPFALSRFCGAEGLNNVIALSAFRNDSFGKDFGVTILDGPLAGLLSRAVIISDTSGKVIYAEQVPEITQEPDYKAALSILQ
ncbi:MAG: thiol peroxidase [Chitinispirillaceae bacterium]|nr:thiol peroxidase [Chitinispirillaceae bacterium]